MCFQTSSNTRNSDENAVNVEKLAGKAYKFSIPIKDVEQASKAMKVHVRLVDLMTFGNTNTSYLQGTGEEGSVNASYSVQQVHHGNKRTRIVVHNYTIKEISDYKTVYTVTSHGGRLNYEVTVSVGRDRSMYGKNLLIIQTSPLGKQGEVPMLLLICFFCCFAPFMKVLMKRLVLSNMKSIGRVVQGFVNTFNYNETDVTQP